MGKINYHIIGLRLQSCIKFCAQSEEFRDNLAFILTSNQISTPSALKAAINEIRETDFRKKEVYQEIGCQLQEKGRIITYPVGKECRENINIPFVVLTQGWLLPVVWNSSAKRWSVATTPIPHIHESIKSVCTTLLEDPQIKKDKALSAFLKKLQKTSPCPSVTVESKSQGTLNLGEFPLGWKALRNMAAWFKDHVSGPQPPQPRASVKVRGGCVLAA